MSREIAGVHVWLVLRKAAQAVEDNARASIAGLDLGLSEFAVLETLLHTGPQPVSVLGRRVLLTSGSITSALDRLQARKLVRRVRDPEDSRSRIVHLTAAGRSLIECAFARHAKDMEEVVSTLGHTERKQIIRLLKKLGIPAAERVRGFSA